MNYNGQEFSLEKVRAIVLYLAIRTPRPSFMSIAKLMYFADKTHLERYGRTLSTDRYVAMQHGPVPSNTYNLLRDTDTYSTHGFKVIDGYYIEAIDAPELGELAGHELDCLDQIIARFGDAPTWYLRHLSHDSAWQRAWQQAQELGKGSHLISEEDLLDMIFAENGNEGDADWPDFIHEFRESL